MVLNVGYTVDSDSFKTNTIKYYWFETPRDEWKAESSFIKFDNQGKHSR